MMNRFLALAALVAGALAGKEDGGGGFSVPNYSSSPTAVVTSFVAAPPMPSSVMANPVMSSMWMSMSSSMSSAMTWQVWSSTPPTMATPTAVAMSSAMSMSAAPSLITITSVATPTASGWPKSPMASHTVVVGGSSLTYTPPSLSGVKDKDTIIFLFMQSNHTLTQSSFASPCDKSDNGFKSGFLPSNGNLIPFVLAEYSDSMNTGSPMWFYCGQGDHCQAGMRFSINAPNDKDTAWRAIDTLGGTMTTSSMMMMSSSMSTMSSSMPMASASIVPGMGTMNNGQCMCDCLCGVNSFPMGAGIGMMGGMPGMIPASAMPTMAPPMSSGPSYGGSGWK